MVEEDVWSSSGHQPRTAPTLPAGGLGHTAPEQGCALSPGCEGGGGGEEREPQPFSSETEAQQTRRGAGQPAAGRSVPGSQGKESNEHP